MPSFEAPGALWLGMGAAGILLLWMLRPRRPRVRIPSVLLWAGSPTERQSARPWQRLHNHPLLWLQVVVTLLAALAAARPFLPAQGASQHLIVLLDASGSLRARDVLPDRFTVARETVAELARAMGPGQTMTVIRLDEEPHVLVASSSDAGQVASALQGQSASYGPADVATGLALAAGLTQGAAEWVMVTDGGLSVSEAAHRPSGTSLRTIQVGDAAGNVALVGLSTRAGGRGLSVQAGVRNLGTRPASGRVQLLADGQLVGAREWQLEPRGETFLSWADLPIVSACAEPGAAAEGTSPPCAAAPQVFEARLAGVDPSLNLLEQDDRAWAVVAPPRDARALLVTTGNLFLERAFTVQSNLRAFRAAPADWTSVATEGEPFPLLVLDRLWPDPPPNGNVLFVGPPTGLSFRPAEIRPRTGHPLLRHVDWSEVHVAAAQRLPLDTTWETVVDSDGGPLLAVREVGGQRQAALAFDLTQSDLALRPAFPILMANLLEWLLPGPSETARIVAPGGAATIDPAPLARQLWVEGPDTPRAELAPPWPPRAFRPPAPGLYRVVQQGDAGQQISMLVAEGYHPQEADLLPRPLAISVEGDTSPPLAQGALTWWPWLAALLLLFSLAEWWIDARWH
jgi:Ca-activated chloride channel homolog